MRYRTVSLFFASLFVAVVGPTWAQSANSKLAGTVVDTSGQGLSGVSVSLKGAGATTLRVTDLNGRFAFAGLPAGPWTISATTGGQTAEAYVAVAPGADYFVQLGPGDTNRVVQERAGAIDRSFDQTDLLRIPSSGTEYDLLAQTPGILMDRINVGGNETGVQASYINPGTSPDQGTWILDGVDVTDQFGTGGFPLTYFPNFDLLGGARVSYGGPDARVARAGAVVNVVTKQATDSWRFSLHSLYSPDDWRSDSAASAGDLGAGQTEFNPFVVVSDYQEYGAEGGGPVVADRFWLWAGYGKKEIDQFQPLAKLTNPIELETFTAKLNARLSSANTLTAAYNFGEKSHAGRNQTLVNPAGLWNQTGPSSILKIEDTHVFSPRFYLSAAATSFSGGFQLNPIGTDINDPNAANVVRLADGTWKNGYLFYDSERERDEVRFDGDLALGGTVNHELRFGASSARADFADQERFPGDGIWGWQILFGRDSLGRDVYLGLAPLDYAPRGRIEQTELYLQDTLRTGRFTFDVGVRYDKQEGTQRATTLRPSPLGNGQLDRGTFPGKDSGFDWADVSPRLGLTYALGKERSTLLSAGFSRFADRLSQSEAQWTNPTTLLPYGYFYWYDDGDLELTRNELGPLLFTYGFDPNAPGSFVTPDRVETNLDAPITDELTIGAEHSLTPTFTLGGNVVWRNYSEILEAETLVCDGRCLPDYSNSRPHTRADYEPVVAPPVAGAPAGVASTAEFWRLRPGVFASGGSLLENGDREQDYLGLSVTFNKRLANRWMLRGHVTWQDTDWSAPDSENEDPTRVVNAGFDGDPVLGNDSLFSGSKGNVFINSGYSFDINGLYQVAPDRPWGFDIAASVHGREGYPIPYADRRNFGDGRGSVFARLVDPLDEFRNDDVFLVDARLEKKFAFNEWGLTVGIDAFNLLDENTVLQRQGNLRLAAGDHVTEIVGARTFRLGVRLSFR